ncbi:Proteasome subunit beta type-1 [Seminavis robusta]|uniref:Proteasome subunit beta n=1 Tax=Seminavis robusta TaxID=568900 RepID=A0A9N8EIK3_9STRA|nr:Proteasome subunit beta type-1 [Seminavis robusta]|eukprot:Sro1228_g254360.1 Proteasome subunit beta type-1 (257) ;mRNA; f:875-1779
MMNSTTFGAPLMRHSEGQVVLGGNGEDVVVKPADYPGREQPYEHRFSPYDFNGGTVAGVSGEDYLVIAADTRMSSGYEILSRNTSKLHQLNPNAILASSGCKTDMDQLRSVLDIKSKIYQHNHRKSMTATSTAQMLSNTLYGRRFFPYYAFNVLGGIDAEGKGCLFSYDAIGSFERTQYSATGSGQAYVIPFLDNVIGNRNRTEEKPTLSKEEVVELMKEAFVSAGERDIYTGDALEIMVMTKDGVTKETFELKKD